jgi:hypothetical protein
LIAQPEQANRREYRDDTSYEPSCALSGIALAPNLNGDD